VHIDRSGPNIQVFNFSQYINGSACVYTSANWVYLNIAADDGDGSGVKELHLRNAVSDWSSWVPFATPMSWTLPPMYGKISVLLEVRDELENTSASSLNVIRDDPFEGCNGNDSLDTAYVTGLELADFVGSILPGVAISGDGDDFYQVSLMEGAGGFVRVNRPAGYDAEIGLSIWDDRGDLRTTGTGTGSFREVYLGKGLGQWDFCDDGIDIYYIQVFSVDSAGDYQPYSLSFETADACPHP
jgi:hypothetical protein